MPVGNDLVKNLELAFQAVGADVKKLLAQDGNLGELTTKQKASLVVAINELDAAVKAIDVKSVIDDGASDTTHVWSAKKVGDEILAKSNALKNELLGGAGGAYDTLKELADLITTNKDAIAALKDIAAGHVRFDQPQSLEVAQKKQARDNIGAADVESVTAAQKKADEAAQKATENATHIGTLTNLQTTARTELVGAINEVVGNVAKAQKAAEDAAAAAAAADKKGQQGITDAAAASGKADKAQGDVDALKAAVGDTTKDFAEVYTTARNGAAA